jgi:hypothetical protein
MESEKIERYNIEADCDCGEGTTAWPSFSGRHVEYAHHLAAHEADAAKIKALRAECRAWRAAYQNWNSDKRPIVHMREPYVETTATNASLGGEP